MVSLETKWLTHQSLYKELKTSFERGCKSIQSLDNPDEREDCVRTSKTKLNEIEDLLARMKSDLSSLSSQHKSSKAMFKKEFRTYQREYLSFRNEYYQNASKHRFLCMTPHDKNERVQLLNNDDQFINIRQKSQESLLLINGIEPIAVNTSTMLHKQGKQLDNINIELKEMNDISDRALKIIKRMNTKLHTDRFLQICIVSIEIVIIILLLWWKLRKYSK